MRGLFLLFILLPIVELWLLIEIGGEIGVLPTVGLLLLAGVVGVQVLRYQGFSTLKRARQRLDQGELPGQELVEGLLLGLGGILLIMPGFLTDGVGLCLILPPSRRVAARWLLGSGRLQAFGREGGGFTAFTFRGEGGSRTGAGRFYEGEFTRESEAGTRLDKPLNEPRSEPPES